MTMPKEWKNNQSSLNKEKEKSNVKPEQTNSKISVEDKMNIQELITKYNLTIDNKSLDEWNR